MYARKVAKNQAREHGRKLARNYTKARKKTVGKEVAFNQAKTYIK